MGYDIVPDETAGAAVEGGLVYLRGISVKAGDPYATLSLAERAQAPGRFPANVPYSPEVDWRCKFPILQQTRSIGGPSRGIALLVS